MRRFSNMNTMLCTGRLRAAFNAGLALCVAVTPASAVPQLPQPDCNYSEAAVEIGGIPYYPSGQAEISKNVDGRLVITNFGTSGRDGWCSVLPNWNGAKVNESTPIKLLKNEALVFTWEDASGRAVQLAVRQGAGPKMTCFMDYTDDAVTSDIVWYKNGNLVKTKGVGATANFKLNDIDLRFWSFHAATGELQFSGNDRNGNTRRIVITPTMALGWGPLTGSMVTLRAWLPGRTQYDGLGMELE